MTNQHLNPKNFIERIVSIFNKVIVVKFDVDKVANTDITQTKEYWSNLAVIS